MSATGDVDLRNERLLIVAGCIVAAIVLLIVIARLTSPQSSPAADGRPYDRCGVARQALEAFDSGRPPPPEWIQDRAEAEKAVRACDRQ